MSALGPVTDDDVSRLKPRDGVSGSMDCAAGEAGCVQAFDDVSAIVAEGQDA